MELLGEIKDPQILEHAYSYEGSQCTIADTIQLNALPREGFGQIVSEYCFIVYCFDAWGCSRCIRSRRRGGVGSVCSAGQLNNYSHWV